ncbi:spermidine dehydrogenase [Campylobacter sp. MIT 99-7217]|uniref:NAD(P)/FAD-dependent oxidoreductase n=1 Tax=Campylobacter sp. MIT 99-7217 TaxID=535091 RepID=UPI00115823CC|nr:NAD(P)/FAD-dependent oxidoreductase [Campylobacter sp. MIT 99-7217]TQR28780.1 spermidine dehydrogenase [Campylobacter sp. MIT 99-7217]
MKRRDFLNGMALSLAASLTPLELLFGKEAKVQMLDNYPPALLGLRGSTNESYEFAHMLRDGESFDFSKIDPEEEYDLVVVGAGLSGLAAACFYQNKFGKDKKILLLDNHDDFGGHARRNEFQTKEGMILSYGGSESFQSPKYLYSKEVNGLLTSLGVDIDGLGRNFDVNFYPDLKLSKGVFFNKETFGVNKVVNGNPRKIIADDIPRNRNNAKSVEDFISEFPMQEQTKKDLIDLFNSSKDYLAGMSKKQKEQYLLKTSYKDFLKDKVKLSEEGINFFEGMTHDFLALGIDSAPCHDARFCFMPGFENMGLDPIDGTELAKMEEPYIYHPVDGNASVARLMVKRLIPAVTNNELKNLEDVTVAKFDYSKLDLATNNVRLRLKATVLNAENIKGGATVSYMSGVDRKMHKIKAKKVVMANYNAMIPYIIPTLPQKQKDALALNIKTSLLYTKVIVRNWQSFMKLGVHDFHVPKMPYARVKLDYPVDIGSYKHPRDPKKPICIQMFGSPQAFIEKENIDTQGLDARAKARLGRNLLFTMSFEEIEKNTRNQLQAMLGGAGFNHKKDILAITVNRWAHCYSYVYNSLYDDEKQSQKIINLARKPFKNITIANSDAAWIPYMHAAIDEAYRAVNQL